MPPSVARKSERGPALQQELHQEFESNEVRVSLLVDVDALLPACYNNSTAVRAREALALSFVDEDLSPRAIPERIYARKPCTSACERPPASSLTFGKVFPAADVASKSRRPSSCGRPHDKDDRTFSKPFWPGPVIARGQGRGPQCGRGRACPLSCCAQSRRPVLRFPCINPYTTRGNEEGRCLLQQPPKQEDTRSSPSSSMELKFELDT